MRRNAPKTLEDIRHPGPRAEVRCPYVRCHATAEKVEIEAGVPLLASLGKWADAKGYASAVLDLTGLPLAAFDYVMPDRAVDDRHVAWYSDTHRSTGAKIEEGVAVLGHKNGDWFAHIHAYWQIGARGHLGHLLPEFVTLADPAALSGFGLRGARFEAVFDPETEFTLFRVREDAETRSREDTNSLIATLAPFTDFHHSVDALSAKLPDKELNVLGLGSFAGAEFRNGAPMTGLVSEILLQTGAGLKNGVDLRLPVRCVDLDGNLRQGEIVPGKAPTLVTCELLITSA